MFCNHLEMCRTQKQQEESRERVATLQSAIKSIAATAANGDSEEAIAADAAAGGEIGLDSFEAKAPGADQLDGLNEVCNRLCCART